MNTSATKLCMMVDPQYQTISNMVIQIKTRDRFHNIIHNLQQMHIDYLWTCHRIHFK